MAERDRNVTSEGDIGIYRNKRIGYNLFVGSDTEFFLRLIYVPELELQNEIRDSTEKDKLKQKKRPEQVRSFNYI